MIEVNTAFNISLLLVSGAIEFFGLIGVFVILLS